MTTAALMPFILPRQFTMDGRPLSGGKIYFYESTTRVPKPTYSDSLKQSYNTNPVILDSAGFAPIYLDSGFYTVIVTDADDVQLEQPLDGVAGTGGSGFGSDTTTFVKTYADLRALTVVYDLVYVAGRSFDGDGGEGWFYHDPNTQLSDDDGFILTTSNSAIKYVRLNQEYIDPRFYGVVYGSAANQYTPFYKSLVGSVAFGVPVVVNGNIYINQSMSVPPKASISVTELGSFTSSTTISMQFSKYSNFKAVGGCFGSVVNPYFDVDTVDAIRLSWMAGNTDDERLLKLFNSGVSYYIKMIVDETVIVAAGTWSCFNPLSFESGSIIAFTAGSNLVLTMTKIDAKPIKILEIPGTISITSINFGDNPAYIEWFGGVGDDSNDCSFPLYQATKSGNVKIVRGKTYKIGAATPPSYPASFSISGEGVIKLYSTKTLGTGSISLQDITIQTPTPHTWFSGTSLTAINVIMPSTYTATTSFIDGCVYSDDVLNRFPVYNGKPAIYNGYLPMLPNSGGLGTDSNGKIIDVTTPITLVSGVDFNISVLNIGWITGGIYSATAKIYPITQKLAKLVVAVEMDGGVPPVSPTTDFAAIDISGITSAAAYWLNRPRGVCFGGTCDLAMRYDAQSVYPVTVPSGVWDINASTDSSSRYVFGGPNGVNNQYSGYHNTQTTPNPHMGWGNIFPNVTYPNANNVKYFIGFTVSITRP